MPQAAKHVIYHGRVQGVGFRYTAHRLAQNHAVTGFVKNLRNGTVELLAEGSPTEIQHLLDDIAAAMPGNIDHADIQPASPTGQYTSFDIT